MGSEFRFRHFDFIHGGARRG